MGISKISGSCSMPISQIHPAKCVRHVIQRFWGLGVMPQAAQTELFHDAEEHGREHSRSFRQIRLNHFGISKAIP